MTRWQEREALRVGLDREIDTAEDIAAQKRAREIREENIRRTAAARK